MHHREADGEVQGHNNIILVYLPNVVYILHYNFALGMTSGSYTARPRLSLGTGTTSQINEHEGGGWIPI